MFDWEWLANLRQQAAQWQLNDARRRDQGVRDGYAQSGEPRPVPMYDVPGQAPEKTPVIKSGRETDAVTGDGTNVTMQLYAGNNHRSFYLYNVYALIPPGGVPIHSDASYDVYASDSDETEWTYIIQHVAANVSGFVAAPIPRSRISVVITGSVPATVYNLRGLWRQDR